jgi:hypothetical protein
MPFYLIRRNVSGATREDVEAGGLRALFCAYDYEGLRWIRSLWDSKKGETICLYEAACEEDIVDHSERSRIPCDEVREVVELGPWLYTSEDLDKPDLLSSSP